MQSTDTDYTSLDQKIEQDRRKILEADARGWRAKMGVYARLSGPGWLQSAITLGGGSLAGGLFLGAMVGYSAMWVQPLAMIMGIIMLSAISYVTLSTGERPFEAINQHVNPVLGWGWVAATMMANIVWCMPQFGLATASLQENLALPNTDGWLYAGTLMISLLCVGIVWFYNTGSKGIRIFEIIIKCMIVMIVVSFLGVVVSLTIAGDLLWGQILAGYLPDPGLLFSPAATLQETIAQTERGASFWTDYVVSGQRDRMITVAATAVGINMTFLLPYSMLARKWDKDYRGLAIFDLSTGLFIPFIIVTSCIVIAAGAQLHNQPAPGLLGETGEAGMRTEADAELHSRFERLLEQRVVWELREYEPQLYEQLREEEARAQNRNRESGVTNNIATGPMETMVTERIAALSDEDRYAAAVLIDRDAWDLARALEPLTGSIVSQYIFGFGVLGVAVSTIVILMLINGFVFAEIFGKPGDIFLNRLGALVVVVLGAVGSLTLWQDEARYFLVIPTSVFGMMLAPIAYIAFFALMNNRQLLGQHRPSGYQRLRWNLLMIIAVLFSIAAAGLAIWSQTQHIPGTELEVRYFAMALIGILGIVAAVIHFRRKLKDTRQQVQ